MKINLDEKNRQILEILQQDCTLSVKDIASKIDLSFTPTYERIKNLEESGVIKKYVALLDRQKIGINLCAYCNITLKNSSATELKKFEKNIEIFPEITEVIRVAGTYDFMLKISAQDINAYNIFITETLSNIENINQYHSSIVMFEVKKETAYKIPNFKNQN